MKCNKLYKTYKETCNPVWDKKCESSSTDSTNKNIQEESQKCIEQRLYYHYNCSKNIDHGHLMALKHMDWIVYNCKQLTSTRLNPSTFVSSHPLDSTRKESIYDRPDTRCSIDKCTHYPQLSVDCKEYCMNHNTEWVKLLIERMYCTQSVKKKDLRNELLVKTKSTTALVDKVKMECLIHGREGGTTNQIILTNKEEIITFISKLIKEEEIENIIQILGGIPLSGEEVTITNCKTLRKSKDWIKMGDDYVKKIV